MTLENDISHIPDVWDHYDLDSETDVFIRVVNQDAVEAVIATQQYCGGIQAYYTHYIDPFGEADPCLNGTGEEGYKDQLETVTDYLSAPHP